jgi:hypothetical protein
MKMIITIVAIFVSLVLCVALIYFAHKYIMEKENSRYHIEMSKSWHEAYDTEVMLYTKLKDASENLIQKGMEFAEAISERNKSK